MSKKSVLIITRNMTFDPKGSNIASYAMKLVDHLESRGYKAFAAMPMLDHAGSYATLTNLFDSLKKGASSELPHEVIKFDELRMRLDYEEIIVIGGDGTMVELRMRLDYEAIIVIGGDGTMVGVCRDLANPRPVLIGVNAGHLGFVTDLSLSSNVEQIVKMLEGSPKTDFIDERRMLLSCANTKGRLLALNEVALKATNGRVLGFSVFLDGEYAYKCRGDGILITTPTGSTAYNASAGGPLIHPSARVIGVTPLLPQSLAHRALVVPDAQKVTVEIEFGEVGLFIDGNRVEKMEQPKTFDIQTVSDFQSVTFRHPDDYSFLRTLREKLNWQLEPGSV